ncbi:hypothetical protein ACFWZ7_24785 [Nocardiopsis alba]|uniref:hypothetical protein n=1 Tax=Nocardiopsis alba TaxID=53437 RepID=UPI003671BB90
MALPTENRRDPSRAPSLWGSPSTPTTLTPPPPTPEPSPPSPDPTPAPAPALDPVPGEVEPVEEGQEPVRVGPGLGERLATWARSSFVPPEIWSQDRPSLAKQLAYARQGLWGPRTGWHRTAAQVVFWAVSFPTSVAAYALEWVGERPSRWIAAVVLISLIYQIPFVPEVLGVLVRLPAWPITATWSALTWWS